MRQHYPNDNEISSRGHEHHWAEHETPQQLLPPGKYVYVTVGQVLILLCGRRIVRLVYERQVCAQVWAHIQFNG